MWELKIMDTDKSLYIAIADAMERDIRNNVLKAGEKLPAQREMAKKVGVNVTTVTRAYKEAEKRGLVYSVVGSGTYVSSDLGQPASLVLAAEGEKKRLEMGLILPLYCAETSIRPVIEKVIKKRGLNSLLRYTEPQGLYRHRLTGSEWISRFGVIAGAENIIVTAGAQHALNCIFTSVFQPGDRIAVDCLTYPGVKTAAKNCGIVLEAIAMDDEGMTPEGLEGAAKHHHIKGVYTVSVMQNPTNAVMSMKRAAMIADIIKKYGLTLIEDDLYRFLSIEGPVPLSSLLVEQSIYIAGISKAFYAGLRTCFVAAPFMYVHRISQAVVDTLWMAPALSAEIACECIASGAADKIIAIKREELKNRARLMEEKLAGHPFRYVPDSMFAWLMLPGFLDVSTFEKAADRNGVHIVSSDKFSVGSFAPPNHVRISLSGAGTAAEFEKGLEVIKRILDREIGPVEGIL